MMLVLKIVGVILGVAFLAGLMALVKCICILCRAEYFKSQGCSDEIALEMAMKEDMQSSYSDSHMANQYNGGIAF